MKNIFVLPTDKPSRLHEYDYLSPMGLSKEPLQWRLGKNIYITSDEEITGFENNIWVIKGDRIFLWQNTMALVSNNKPKKIILTTDIYLINDGVQAIDDEFLKWICKNPSCEEVEVIKEDWILNPDVDYFYKIIIPRTTQQIIDEDFAGGLDMGQILPKEELSTKLHKGEILDESYPKEFKQETLEKVAENYVDSFEFGIAHPRRVCKNAFINGAKWQQKQDIKELKPNPLLMDEAGHWDFPKSTVDKMKPLQEQWQQDMDKELMKQEKIEEVAEKYANDWEEIHPELYPENMTPIAVSKIDFIEGAKWQINKQDEFTLGFLHWYNTSQECETYLRRNYPKNITMNGEHYKKVLEINKELLEMYKNTLPR